jgi:hypothetical protein
MSLFSIACFPEDSRDLNVAVGIDNDAIYKYIPVTFMQASAPAGADRLPLVISGQATAHRRH